MGLDERGRFRFRHLAQSIFVAELGLLKGKPA